MIKNKEPQALQNIEYNTIKSNTFNFKIEYIVFFLIIVMVFVFGFRKIYSPDLGFHLEAGEWMFANKKIMMTEAFTYTRFGEKYIDLNWLYQISIFSIFKWSSSSGLVIFNSLLITLSVVLLMIRMRFMRITNYHFAALLMIIGIPALSTEIRPHVFSWIFLNLVLLVLELYKSKKTNHIFLLPIIMLVWINFHSLAILGIFAIAAYVLGSYLYDGKIEKRLMLVFFTSIAAFIINPYFIEGSLYPFHQFTLITGGFEKQYIAEFQSPFNLKGLKAEGITYLLDPTLWLQLLSIVSVVACYKLLKSKNYSSLIVCLGFLFILSLAVKNYGYFFFAALPYIVASFQIPKQSITNRNKSLPTPSLFSRIFSPKRVNVLSCALAIIIAITSVTDGFGILTKNPYRFGTSIDERQLPVIATNFLAENNIHGKILNHLDFGGYLEHFYSEKTYIDGRLEVIGKTLFEEYYNGRTRKDGIQQLITKYNPDIIIFPYLKATNWWEYLMKNPNWKVIHVDCIAVIYVRSNKFPDQAAVTEEFLMKQISQYSPQQITELLKQDKPSRMASFFSSLIKCQDEAINHENLSMYCFTVGFNNAALLYSAAAIDESTVTSPIIYFNLYQYYKSKGDYAMANLYLKKSGRKR